MVNHGTERFYDPLINDIDFVFVQLYNTTHYKVDELGNCPAQTGYTQKDFKFSKYILLLLKRIIPTKTTIILGHPASAAASPAGGILSKSLISDFYNYCMVYRDIKLNDPESSRITTGSWSTYFDETNPVLKFGFAKASKYLNCEALPH